MKPPFRFCEITADLPTRVVGQRPGARRPRSHSPIRAGGIETVAFMRERDRPYPGSVLEDQRLLAQGFLACIPKLHVAVKAAGGEHRAGKT